MSITKGSKKFGRPTTYRKEYAQMLIDYFPDQPYTIKDMEVKKYNSDGKQIATIDKTELEPLPPRFLSTFAREILGVDRAQLNHWADKHIEFRQALNTAKLKEIQQYQIGASMGLYNPTFSIFTLKNIDRWADEQDKVWRDSKLEISGQLDTGWGEVLGRVMSKADAKVIEVEEKKLLDREIDA